MSDLATPLSTLLADTVALYFRAHGHHWNVEGTDFQQFHTLFETIYSDIYDSIDPLAENIRKVGEYAPFKLERFVELKTLSDKRVPADGLSLSRDLLEGNELLIEELKAVFRVCNDADEQGLCNFIAGRIEMHQKWSWQLKAVLK
jgi:starvation-inducible DNA-binding protein